MKKILSFLLIICLISGVGCPGAKAEAEFSEKIDMTKWQYNASDDVYWQVGIRTCSLPADLTYETLGVFVPGAYFDALPNGDGTYTCTVLESGTLNGYTAASAPVLFPVNTPGHKAQSAPTGYVKSVSAYTNAGFVYVSAGCRGKDAGIPAGVTDLKAAIRYIRHNLDLLPGDTERFAAFGHSGGGSQTAVLGASGNSPLYTPYLEAIGAVQASDAISAAMCWCPITGFDSADEGHEWSMGVTRSGLSDEMQSISDALAAAYADYVNAMGFTDEAGNTLTLIASDNPAQGIFQAGSYYDYVKGVIEESLKHYLEDTAFPLSFSGKGSGDVAYRSPADYISALNGNDPWITYDEETGKVTIDSVQAFTTHLKKASKPIAAFDKLADGGHELFNTGDGACTHFDRVLYEIIKGTEYEEDFARDLAAMDEMGNSMDYRLRMFSPLSYLMKANQDYGTADVAAFWRIRTGITQSDTPLTTEINLALALTAYGANVDFETVWAQGHTQAERTGNASDNFIAWLNEIFH